MKKEVVEMDYLSFYGFKRAPFVKNLPAESLYESQNCREAMGRLRHGIDHQYMLALVGEPGVGKSTLIRRLATCLPRSSYKLIYTSQSGLTPKWLYNSFLSQMNLKEEYFLGPAKRSLQNELKAIAETEKTKVIFALDEAHLLDRDTLEEFRFLLNSEYDSVSPVSLILIGQKELLYKLSLKEYRAIHQRIDQKILLEPYDRSDVERYIRCQFQYAGKEKQDIFTANGMDALYTCSAGLPRLLNRICNNTLFYGMQQNKKLLDDMDVQYVVEHESLRDPCDA